MIYIISHSSIDLISVLNLYERYKNMNGVTILISSVKENFQFLQSVNVPRNVLRFLHFESKYNRNKKNIIKWICQLLKEKKHLDSIVCEIIDKPENELFFHSYSFDFHMGYLVAQVAKKKKVTLVDMLGIMPKKLRYHDLLSLTGIKTTLLFIIISLIFGRYFILSGTRSYPMISLNMQPLKMDVVPRTNVCMTQELSKYRFVVASDGVNIIVNYAEPFGITDEKHIAVYKSIIDCLIENKLNIFVKLHPQSNPPLFFKNSSFNFIPKYIPFEFIDLTNISLVIGIQGASLLCTGTTTTISFVKMIYSEDSSFYKTATEQLSMNKDIKFISSVAALQLIINKVK